MERIDGTTLIYIDPEAPAFVFRLCTLRNKLFVWEQGYRIDAVQLSVGRWTMDDLKTLAEWYFQANDID